jgi:hypothetical protein
LRTTHPHARTRARRSCDNAQQTHRSF